ncbi:hypothetical protein GF373_07810, partial [bacterium]|nr:hypothetical protein [bacterium]
MKRAFFIGIIFTCFYIPSTICTESKPALTYEEVLKFLHFEDHDRRALEEGKVQAKELEPRSDKELAISVAVMIDKPLPAIYDSLHAGRLMKHTSKLQGFQRIHIDPLKLSAFTDVSFNAEEEIQNLFHAQPGTMFNLSQNEIKQISDLRDRFVEITHENKSQITQSLSQIYQKFLFERCRNYVQLGIKQIPPYAREEGKTNPGKELKLAVKESKWLNTYYPKFCQAFREYPHRQNKRYEHRFYWI